MPASAIPEAQDLIVRAALVVGAIRATPLTDTQSTLVEQAASLLAEFAGLFDTRPLTKGAAC